MALIKCETCGKEISDSVKTCVHCGSPRGGLAEPKKKLNMIGLVSSSVAVLSYLVLIVTTIIMMNLVEANQIVTNIYYLAPMVGNLALAVAILSFCLPIRK